MLAKLRKRQTFEEPNEGPSQKIRSRKSPKPMTGSSRESVTKQFWETISESLDTVGVYHQDMMGEVEVYSSSSATCAMRTLRSTTPVYGVGDQISETIVEHWSTMNDSDDDVEDMDTTELCTQTMRDTLTEPSCESDMTSYQQRVLYDEDVKNDQALRLIAPPNSYKFNWTNKETTFLSHRETFVGTPGPTFSLTDKTSVLDIFYKMMDSDFIDMIVEETNRYANQKILKLKGLQQLFPRSRLHRWSPTDRDEIIRFLSIIILQGLYPLPEERSFFSYNGFTTMPFFKNIMSYTRFQLLNTMLHFVDNETTEEDSRLYKIQPVVDYYNRKFSSLYYPSQEIVIDETLLKWHGKLSFSQKISSKASKVGIKTYELCESETGYLWQLIVDVGRDTVKDNEQTDIQPTTTSVTNNRPDNIKLHFDTRKTTGSDVDRFKIDLSGAEREGTDKPENATVLVVYKLIEPLLYRGHTLIMDNFYNSPLLARCLKKQGTDCYGTLRTSREFVPDSIKKINKTELQKGEVVYSYCSDVSVMVWRDATLVGMISTYHRFRPVTVQKHDKLTCKPKIVLDYNKTMGEIYRKNQFLSYHPKERTKNRVWYKKLFRRLFNAAIFNCFILYNRQHSSVSQRCFRVMLAEGLLNAHRKAVPALMTMTRPHHRGIKTQERCVLEDDHFPIRTGTRQTRCWLCSQRKVVTRTIWKCKQCQVNLCIDICFRAYHKM